MLIFFGFGKTVFHHTVSLQRDRKWEAMINQGKSLASGKIHELCFWLHETAL